MSETDQGALGLGREVFIRDAQTDSTEAIGAESWSDSGLELSADGRYLAFSCASGCPILGANVYDRELGTFELIPSGAGGYFTDTAISADGRHIAFGSLFVPDRLASCWSASPSAR